MTEDSATLLLVEDDPVIRVFLADNLIADGYELIVAETFEDALEALERERPDLAVFDVHLPDGSGLDLLRRVRGADGVASRLDPTLPVLILSGAAEELDRLRGLERGADDYVVKPFSYAELRLRIAAVLRRVPHAGAARDDAGRVAGARPGGARGHRCVGAGSTCPRRSSRCCACSPAPRRACSRRTSCSATSGASAPPAPRGRLDSHACRLRQKLREDGDEFVVNVWGVGVPALVDGPYD